MNKSTKIVLGVLGFSFLIGVLGHIGSTNSNVKSTVTTQNAQSTISPVKSSNVSLQKITKAPTLTPTPTPIPTDTPVPTTYVAPQTYIQPTTSSDSTQSTTGLSNNNYYTNVNGDQVHSPAYSTNNSVPVGATALCGDGTYSFSEHHSGTCSHHGGVAQWLQ